jgi:hypothetical protein
VPSPSGSTGPAESPSGAPSAVSAPSPSASVAPSGTTTTDSGVWLIAVAIVVAGLLIGAGVGVNGYLRRKRG